MRGEGREEEREKNNCVVDNSHTPPTGNLAHNPGICPDWESNLRLLGLQASTQPTEPQQPGLPTLKKSHLVKKRQTC